ncbi:MAG TPA: hypothetical protein VH475_27475 [Tepidisphaeraceae bacterium]
MSHRLEPLERRTLFASPVTYTLVELDFQPQDLNNTDQIVGRDLHQIRRGGRLTTMPLPTLDPANNPGGVKLNDDGIIIGSEGRILPTDDSVGQAVILGPDATGQYQSRYLFDGTTPDDSQANLFCVINNRGQIITSGDGDTFFDEPIHEAVLGQVGARGRLSITPINSLRLPGETLAVNRVADLNNLGQLVTSNPETDPAVQIDNFAVLRRGHLYLTPASTLSGDTGSQSQQLASLNDSGQIVGDTAATLTDSPAATLYQLSARGRYYRTFLAALPGDDAAAATQINNVGQILGYSYSTPGSGPILDMTATITQRRRNGRYGATQDLNALIPDPGKDRVTRPIAINDGGLILAEGVSTSNGSQRFLLLIPSRANRLPTSPIAAAAMTSPLPGLPTMPLAATRATSFAKDDQVRSDDDLW